MRKVTGTMALVAAFRDGRGERATLEAGLEALEHLPHPSLARFVVMTAAGAAALAVVFGVTGLTALLLIAATSAAGGLLRRGLATVSHNLFIQPLAAALLAGLAGGLALVFGGFSSLVALCPCMILVPGPHLLNGALDLIRGRIALGAARIVYASMTIVTICVGLLLGLTLVGASLPADASMAAVPLALDVAAAGVAVLAYGSYFAMPWRMLPIPVVIGMAAHALRWGLITLAHASPTSSAFGACLMVGVLMTPIADRLHLPFAGCAFAAVVSLIPGVFLFRMAGSLVQIMAMGRDAKLGLLAAAAGDGATGVMILIAMAAGLIIPPVVWTPPPADG